LIHRTVSINKGWVVMKAKQEVGTKEKQDR
jgi:hypothetical protein